MKSPFNSNEQKQFFVFKKINSQKIFQFYEQLERKNKREKEISDIANVSIKHYNKINLVRQI